ncbi:MAG: flagellar biosynthesis protein FlgM [Spirochaeta sp. LUC14_002_19_P3]|nr:MAG: flagellar biosynthesis protein FlgM [Spirochaeta sp. LUC14_002_19_P3]
MTIERLGPVEPATKINKTKTSAEAVQSAKADSVTVSEEARRTAALQQTADIVHAAPDIRMDRVEEVKAKLQDPNYINDKVVASVADSILDAFGIK